MSAAENWQFEAACLGVDPDLFFPGLGEDAEPAKRICAECPIRERCLDDAIERGEKFGVWGGKSERERRRIRRQRLQERSLAGTTVPCQVCGRLFVRRSNNHKACSDVCSLAAQRRRQRAWEMSRG